MSQIRANLLWFSWARRKVSGTLQTFGAWKFYITQSLHPRNQQGTSPAQIACIPPSPSTEALKGTAAAFTEHKKSVSTALANKNKTQNKRYEHKPNLDHKPAAQGTSQATRPSALLMLLSKKAWEGAATRPPALLHLTPGGNPTFIKNNWWLQFHLKNKQAWNLDKLTTAPFSTTWLAKKTGANKQRRGSAFSGCSLHTSLEHLQELPSRAHLFPIPRQILEHRLCSARGLQCRLGRQEGRSQAMGRDNWDAGILKPPHLAWSPVHLLPVWMDSRDVSNLKMLSDERAQYLILGKT